MISVFRLAFDKNLVISNVISGRINCFSFSRDSRSLAVAGIGADARGRGMVLVLNSDGRQQQDDDVTS